MVLPECLPFFIPFTPPPSHCHPLAWTPYKFFSEWESCHTLLKSLRDPAPITPLPTNQLLEGVYPSLTTRTAYNRFIFFDKYLLPLLEVSMRDPGLYPFRTFLTKTLTPMYLPPPFFFQLASFFFHLVYPPSPKRLCQVYSGLPPPFITGSSLTPLLPSFSRSGFPKYSGPGAAAPCFRCLLYPSKYPSSPFYL